MGDDEGSELARAAFWDQRADAWERRVDSLEAFSDTYGLPAIDALAPAPGERALDIGCGPGATAIALAGRVAPGGEVVGVDISEGMIAAARRRAERSGTGNVTFAVADAQRDPLGRGFDLAFSRFGVMFFDDPVAAFANIRAALRPGGRFGAVVWGELAENPWMFVPTLAASQVVEAELAIPGPSEPGPFSLADPARILEVVGGGGFVDIDVEPLAGERVVTDATFDDDVRALLEVGPLGAAMAAADDEVKGAAVRAVLAAMDPYRVDDGWRLPGQAMRIIANRP